jgi:lysophospholipase L1-like esterase
MKVRLFALFSAVLLFVLAASPASASTSGSTASQGPSYLSLGDSVPFGFNPFLDFSNIHNFVGYPEIVAKRLHLKDVNATCPGEATGGFLSWTGADNGCHPYRQAFPLHVNYPPPETQMDFAVGYLRSHPNTRLVTLTLGANDTFLFLKANPECAVSPFPASCFVLVAPVLATIYANLNIIFTELRSTGYTGLIVVLTYYPLDYRDTAGVVALNSTIIAAATPYGALIASGLDAWAATALAPPFNGDTCAAGLRIVKPVTPTPPADPCDVHPSPLGRDLLASAVVATVASSCPANNAIDCVRPTD